MCGPGNDGLCDECHAKADAGESFVLCEECKERMTRFCSVCEVEYPDTRFVEDGGCVFCRTLTNESSMFVLDCTKNKFYTDVEIVGLKGPEDEINEWMDDASIGEGYIEAGTGCRWEVVDVYNALKIARLGSKAKGNGIVVRKIEMKCAEGCDIMTNGVGAEGGLSIIVRGACSNYKDRCNTCKSLIFSTIDEKIIVKSEQLKKHILKCVFDLGGNYGRTTIARVLTGSVSKKILTINISKLGTYAVEKNTPQKDILAVMDTLLEDNYLAYVEDADFPVIVVTSKGLDVLAGDM
jgi:hypothetical protein